MGGKKGPAESGGEGGDPGEKKDDPPATAENGAETAAPQKTREEKQPAVKKEPAAADTSAQGEGEDAKVTASAAKGTPRKKTTGKKPPAAPTGELKETEQRFVESVLAPYIGENALFAHWVDFASHEPKQPLAKQKWQRRIFVVGRFRFFVVSKGMGGRKHVDISPHLFDVAALGGLDASSDDDVASKKKVSKKKPPVSGAEVLRISVSTGVAASEDGAATTTDAKKKVYLVKSPEVVDILTALRLSYTRISAHFGDREFVHPFSMLVNVPPEHVRPLEIPPEDTAGSSGLNNTYVAMCNYRAERVGIGFPRFVEELMRRQTQVMQLNHCPGIEQRSEVALATGSVLQSLNFNPYFRAVILRRVTLDKGRVEPGLCVRYNNSITKLVLTGIDGSVDWVNFGRVLAKNSEHQLQILEVSNNILKLKDVDAISTAIEAFPHSLPVLRMAGCALRAEAIERLMGAFMKRFEVSLTIRELDLSNNEFGDGGTAALAKWLHYSREFSQLQRLCVAASKVNIALLEEANIGLLLGLETLDLGESTITSSGVKVIEGALFDTPALSKIRLAGMKGMDGAAVSSIMAAMLQNTDLHDIEMDFSGNGALGKDAISAAEAVSTPLRTLAEKMYSLKSLDFTGCRLGAIGVESLLRTLQENCMTLAELSIGGNIHDPKDAQECQDFASALVSFFEGGTGVTKLSLSTRGSLRIGNALEVFFRYLADDQGLEELDFWGNFCGDRAFLTLTESLCSNFKIHTLKIDNNHLGYNAYLSLRQVLERNLILRDIEHPSMDLARIREKYMGTNRILELRDTVFAFESRLAANLAKFQMMNVSEDDFADIPYDPDEEEEDVDPSIKVMRLYASWWPKAADKDDAEPPAKAAPLDEIPPHLVDGIPVTRSGPKRKSAKTAESGEFSDLSEELLEDGIGAGERKGKAKGKGKDKGKDKDKGKGKGKAKTVQADKNMKKATGKDGETDAKKPTTGKKVKKGEAKGKTKTVQADKNMKKATGKDSETDAEIVEAGSTEPADGSDPVDNGGSTTEGVSVTRKSSDGAAGTDAINSRAEALMEKERRIVEMEKAVQEKITRRKTLRDIRKAQQSESKARHKSMAARHVVVDDDLVPLPQRAAPPAPASDSDDDGISSRLSGTSVTADLDTLVHVADDVHIASPGTHVRVLAGLSGEEDEAEEAESATPDRSYSLSDREGSVGNKGMSSLSASDESDVEDVKDVVKEGEMDSLSASGSDSVVSFLSSSDDE